MSSGFEDGPALPKNLNSGHRERLKQRFRSAGPDALADYELLELLLFRSIPRRDTKPLAKTLLDKFGSLADVVAAPDARLKEIDGVGDAVTTDFKIIQAVALRLGQEALREKTILSSWSSVLAYCRTTMAYEKREQFRILFLDRKNALIADEVQQTGTIDHTPVYPREVVKRALDHSASAILLVHNHPSGDPTPSRADIDMTKKIVEASKALGIAVHDHVIIGRDGHASLKALGLM